MAGQSYFIAAIPLVICYYPSEKSFGSFGLQFDTVKHFFSEMVSRE
jgi:hypothetical protein